MPKRTNREQTSPTDNGAAMTINQAHSLIGKNAITRQAIYLAAERGELPVLRLGRKVLILRKPFEEWLAGEGARPRKGTAA